MELGKAQLLLGVHKHVASSTSYTDPSKGAVKATTVKSDATCPAFGFVYQPDKHVSLYASHSEFFDSGTKVGAGYENENDILSPSKAKSNEVGVKYENNGLLTTLAFFQNKEANSMTVYNDDFSKKWLTNNGENEYQGIELSVNGKISDKWKTLWAALCILMPKERKQKKEPMMVTA